MAVRYNPRAEPTIGSYTEGRPAYVRRIELESLAASGEWRRCCVLGGSLTSLERLDGVWTRAVEEWGTPHDLETAIAWWMPRGLKAANPGGLLRQAFPEWYRVAPWSCHGFALRYCAGGWEEAQVRGRIVGPHKMYDIRKAYRAALTEAPLPDRRTMTVAYRYMPDVTGVQLVDMDPCPRAPWPMRDGGRVLIETPIDLQYCPNITAWVAGMYWHKTCDTQGFGEGIDSIGVPALQRAYWGMWICQSPVINKYRSGKTTELPAHFADGVRAHLITQRVRRKLAAIETHYRYTDAVIVRADHAMAVGDSLGDWRVTRDYPDGVSILYPGAYGPLTGPLDRAAGVKKQ